MKYRLALVLSALFGLTLMLGCGRAFVVKRTDANATSQPEGIPFFVKSSVCKHETVWLQPIYTLSLKKGAPAGVPRGEMTPLVIVLSLQQYRSAEVEQLLGAIAGATTSENQIKSIEDKWAAVAAKAENDPFKLDEGQLSGRDKNNVLKVANVNSPELYVDYSKVYYYNQSKPLAGTSQASLKLAGDGTMTEATAQSESKTLQAFLDLLPIKTVLSSLAMGAPVKATEARETVKYELAVDVNAYKHTHFQYLTDKKPPCGEPTSDVTGNYNLIVEDVSETKKKNTDDGNAISVSGTIKLPDKK